MFSTLQIKVAIAIAIASLIGYVYYDVIVKPQNEITALKEEVRIQKAIPAKIVSKINKADANRTQGKINEIKNENNSTIIGDSGVLIFDSVQ